MAVVGGAPLAREDAGEDARFDETGRSFVLFSEPRMYRLVRNSQFNQRLLQLVTRQPGLLAYAFTFVTCVAAAEAAGHDAPANIRAAAAWLAGAAADAGVSAADPQAWAGIAADYSGIQLAAGRTSYVEHVNALLEPAVRMRVTGAPTASEQAACPATPGPDEASAVWRPSPNFNQRPADSTGGRHLVIIHTCERAYTLCWSWLVNPASQVTAHYVDGRISGDMYIKSLSSG